MSTIAITALTSAATVVTSAAPAPRLDRCAHIHKALRLFIGDMLARVGRVDLNDSAEISSTLAQLEALLDLCRGPVAH